MPDTSTLLVFAAAALALIVVPGPAVLYIVAQSIDRGRLAGFVSALGIAVGGLVHVSAAAIGLSSLLVSSATAFAAVKYAGAAYLIGLGLYTLLVRKEEPAAALPRERRLRRRFGQGVVVNVLNPKTALFFFAFLPQFVDPDKGSAALQIGILGLLFVAPGGDQRQRLGARRRERLGAAAGQPAVPRRAALRLRIGLRRPRRTDRQREEVLALPARRPTLRPMIYCVIPRELETELFDKMVEYYKDNPNVTVIVDRREGDDRRNGQEYGGLRETRDRRRARIPGTFPETDPE